MLYSSEFDNDPPNERLRIAQVAPLYESVPPQLYGGTERVVSWLTEELVGLGPRRDPICQWRFADKRPSRARLSESALA